MVMMVLITMMAGFIGCATTSGINISGINESKLTNITYLKKICDVKLIDSEKDDVVYLLDNGKGYFVYKKNNQKVCLIVKDGELYGRSESYLPHDITVALNLHDSKCTQICTEISSSDSNTKYFYYYPDEQLDKMAEYLKDGLLNLAKQWDLEKYIE